MTAHNNILITPLTAEAFAPFGDVIEAKSTNTFLINNGQAQRFHDLAKIDVSMGDGRPLISLVRSAPTQFPLTLKLVERHPLGSQAFIPLGNYQFLIVVALTNSNDLPDTLHAFLSNGQQGINYKPGVWHHPLIVFDHTTDFLVIDRGGAGNNCDVVELDGNMVIEALAVDTKVSKKSYEFSVNGASQQCELK
ncbi:MAG: ureidoglycolate lyase [Sulfuriferula sp.]